MDENNLCPTLDRSRGELSYIKGQLLLTAERHIMTGRIRFSVIPTTQITGRLLHSRYIQSLKVGVAYVE